MNALAPRREELGVRRRAGNGLDELDLDVTGPSEGETERHVGRRAAIPDAGERRVEPGERPEERLVARERRVEIAYDVPHLVDRRQHHVAQTTRDVRHHRSSSGSTPKRAK